MNLEGQDIMMALCIGRNIFTVKIFVDSLLLFSPGHRVEVVHEVCHVLGEVLRLTAVGPAEHSEVVSAGSVVTFKSLILSPSLTAAWTMTVCG